MASLPPGYAVYCAAWGREQQIRVMVYHYHVLVRARDLARGTESVELVSTARELVDAHQRLRRQTRRAGRITPEAQVFNLGPDPRQLDDRRG